MKDDDIKSTPKGVEVKTSNSLSSEHFLKYLPHRM